MQRDGSNRLKSGRRHCLSMSFCFVQEYHVGFCNNDPQSLKPSSVHGVPSTGLVLELLLWLVGFSVHPGEYASDQDWLY